MDVVNERGRSEFLMPNYRSLCEACRKRRCKYYSLRHDGCDYMLITGHARSKICPPGEKCTVWATGKKPKTRAQIAIAPKRQEEDRPKSTGRPSYDREAISRHIWPLYEEERLSDRKIGELVGVSEGYIRLWRKLHGYPPNHNTKEKRGPQKPPWED